MRRLSLFRFLIAGAWLFLAGWAEAEPPTLAGRWNASALRSDWNIGEWGSACGPEPSGGGAAGGNVIITQSDSELSMNGAGRNYSTSECWEQFPGLSRVSHTGGRRGWRTTCKTKASDPRQASIVTTINATDNQISFDETGQYQFVISGQNCTASVRRTRNLVLEQREGEAPSVASATPVVAAPAPLHSAATTRAQVCKAPGPPVRLEVRPSKKLMRPGESFEFHSLVLDSAGCVLPLSAVWKVLSENAPVELSGPGKIRVREGAAESTVQLQATLAGRSTRVLVEIASEQQYDALLAQRGLNAQGESTDAAAARIATTQLGGASVITRDDSERRRVLFVGVVGGAALLLGLLGFVLLQRSRRKPKPPASPAPRAHQAPVITPNSLPPVAKMCPTCREEYPPDAAFCPIDGNRLIALLGPVEPNAPSGGVCPVCGHGYDPGVSTCPKHGEELVPAALQATARFADSPTPKKICPMCGKQYAGDSQFCGGCGAALVPVN